MNDLIEKLSNLRSQFNCFDENERDAYHTLSEAIKALSSVTVTSIKRSVENDENDRSHI